MKICLLFFNALGDMVRITPTIQAIRSNYPDSYLAVVTEALSSEIIQNNPNLDDIFTFDPQIIKQEAQKDSFSFAPTFNSEINDLLQSLLSIEFDLVVNLQFSEVSALFAHLIDAPLTLGRSVDKEGISFIAGEKTQQLYELMKNKNNSRITNKKHLCDLLIETLCDLQINPHPHAPKIYLNENEILQAKTYLKPFCLNGNLLIGIQVGAGHNYSLKGWSIEKFIDLLKRLHQNFPKMQFYLNGSDAEKQTLIKELKDNLDFKLIVAPKKATIRDSIALINECDLFLSNVSGPMHIAAALRVPTIGLFGRDFPHESRPYGKGNMICLQNTMQQITTDEVYTAMITLLKYHRKLPGTIEPNYLKELSNTTKEFGTLLYTR